MLKFTPQDTHFQENLAEIETERLRTRTVSEDWGVIFRDRPATMVRYVGVHPSGLFEAGGHRYPMDQIVRVNLYRWPTEKEKR